MSNYSTDIKMLPTELSGLFTPPPETLTVLNRSKIVDFETVHDIFKFDLSGKAVKKSCM